MKILWVKAGGLVPLDTGGKLRSYNILRGLSSRHDITFFTFYEEHPNDEHADLRQMFTRVICHPLRLSRAHSFDDVSYYASRFVSRQPYQILRYCKPQVTESLGRLLQQQRFDVIVCDFLVAAGVIPWKFPLPKVLFTHNVEALIWKRHCDVARNPVWKAICWREYRTTAQAERRYLSLTDHVLTVSETDREYFLRLDGPAKITVIPTGVDLEFFQPRAAEERPNTIVFTGSMDWMPNEDGIFYFVQDILPRIRKKIPDASLLVVGRNPSSRLVDLGRTTKGMEITGKVDDIRPYVCRGSVYVVPLRVGSGTRLKIFEAMAMGKAVVSTSIGAEGLPVRAGTNIVIADDPADFANAVISLLQHQGLRNEIGRAARVLVAQRYGWESAVQHFDSVLETLVCAHGQDVVSTRT